MSQHAFGEALSLDPSNVVGLLNELEEQGLVVRQRDPADRRRHIVELSATGQGELDAANSQLRLVEDDLLRALSAEERATLYRLLVRAAGVIAPRYDSACTSAEPPGGPAGPGGCLGLCLSCPGSYWQADAQPIADDREETPGCERSS